MLCILEGNQAFILERDTRRCKAEIEFCKQHKSKQTSVSLPGCAPYFLQHSLKKILLCNTRMVSSLCRVRFRKSKQVLVDGEVLYRPRQRKSTLTPNVHAHSLFRPTRTFLCRTCPFKLASNVIHKFFKELENYTTLQRKNIGQQPFLEK